MTWEGPHLTAATESTTAATYVYDADGLLVRRVEGGAETRYLWDKSEGGVPRVLATYDASGVLLESFVWDAHGLLQVRSGGATSTVIRDRLGSIRGLTDGTGAVTDTYQYDAYGAPSGGTGTTSLPFGWEGHLYDEDFGVYYAQARWYDPDASRFLSRDPAPGRADAPLTLHPYLYGRGDPIHWVTPPVTSPSRCHSPSRSWSSAHRNQRDVWPRGAAAGHVHDLRADDQYPLRWAGPSVSASISAGFIGGAGFIFAGTASNDEGSTTASVGFVMGGATFGTKGVFRSTGTRSSTRGTTASCRSILSGPSPSPEPVPPWKARSFNPGSARRG